MELRVRSAASALVVAPAMLATWVTVLLTIALHLCLRDQYGYQRDELYFVACAKQLAWGYVDQPPLIALVVELTMRLFGDSLSALRIFPALAAGGLVGLTGCAAGRFGGGLFARSLAMVGVLLAPFDLAVGNLLTMNAFEPLLWLGLTLLVLDQIDQPHPGRWVAIGIVIGVGILNKWSMGLYAMALLAGLLLSPVRRSIVVPGLALAIAVAATIVAPNIGWQALHGWPQLQVLRSADLVKNERVTVPVFFLEQLPLMNPFCAPLWIAGLVTLVRSRRYAGLALGYGILVGIELALHGKVYYVAPIYPALIAAGAAAFERATVRRPRGRIALTAAVVVAGLAILPLATPALPLAALLTYQHALDVRMLKMEDHPVGRVPQQFADQLGWPELESTVARAVSRLAPSERASAAILTADYGQAAAIDFLGRHDALPPAISGHNQYFVWGPHGEHAAIVAVGLSRAELAREYASIERVGTYVAPYVLPQNDNLPVYICRRPRIPLVRFWPHFQRYG